MHKLTHKIKGLGVRRIAFSLVVLAYLGFLAVINALMFLPILGLLPDNTLSAMGHFGDFLGTGDTHNLIHELSFSLIIGTAAVGLLFQLWKPFKNVAGQLIALIVWVVMILLAIITSNWVPGQLFITFGGLTLLATILHPAGRGLFNWFSVAKLNRTLLALVIIAAVPLLVFAFTNIGLQTAGTNINQSENGGSPSLFGHKIPKHDDGDTSSPADIAAVNPLGMTMDDGEHDQEHVAIGHYRNMAVFSFIIILIGVLASFRPKGWRLAVWVAGVLPILLGLASVVLPTAESSLGVAWGLVATAWGLAFIVVGEIVRRKELKTTQEL